MRRAVVLLGMLVVACSQATQPVAGTTPRQGAGSCRLPISLIVDAKRNLQGAFVDFPSGKVTVDPKGLGGAAYDRPFKRWVPADPNAVSPGGARYAYLEAWAGFEKPGRLHVVDVVTGKDRVYVIDTPSKLPLVILAFSVEGIWLTNSGYEGPGSGLFLLDLATGALQDPGLPRITEPVAGADGVFWFTDSGPNPQVAAIGFPVPELVLRLTIADGKSEVWFAKPGSYVRVLGTDLAGHPIIAAWLNGGDCSGETIWLASSPAQANVIGVLPGASGPLADGHGVWFGSGQGIYLYSEAGGMKKIIDQPANPAGACV